MSKARSPREVCSTTIGTSGLIVLASVSLSRPDSSRRLAGRSGIGRGPQPAGSSGRARLLADLLGRPQLLARLRLRRRDRLGSGRDQLDGPARGQFLAHLLKAPAAAQVLQHLLGRDALALGSRRGGLEKFLLGWTDALCRDDRREHRLAAQGELGVGLKLGEDLLLGAPDDLRVGLTRDAPMGERVQHPLPHLARTRLDQLGGDRNARPRHRGVERSLAEVGLDPFLFDLDEAPRDVLAQLLQAVETGVYREVLIGGGQLLELDLLDRHLEGRLASGEFTVVVVGRKGDLDGPRLAGGGTEQTLLEAGDQVAATQFDQLVAAIAAGQLLQVHATQRSLLLGGVGHDQRAHVVDDDEVALAGRTIHALKAREALAHRLDLLLDRVLADSRLAAGHLEARVLAQLGPRQHADLDRELERLSLGRQLAERHLRIAHRDDAGGLDGVGIPAREGVAHGSLEDGLAADALDHERGRHLALAEARQLQLAPELMRLALQSPLHLAGGDLHLQTHARVRQLGHGGAHGGWHPCHDTVPFSERPPTPTGPRQARRDVAVDRPGEPPRRRRAGLRRSARRPSARAGTRSIRTLTPAGVIWHARGPYFIASRLGGRRRGGAAELQGDAAGHDEYRARCDLDQMG